MLLKRKDVNHIRTLAKNLGLVEVGGDIQEMSLQLFFASVQSAEGSGI